eukprot:scaffold129583_cov14-Tisochrysis_lutea.AAC.1
MLAGCSIRIAHARVALVRLCVAHACVAYARLCVAHAHARLHIAHLCVTHARLCVAHACHSAPSHRSPCRSLRHWSSGTPP